MFDPLAMLRDLQSDKCGASYSDDYPNGYCPTTDKLTGYLVSFDGTEVRFRRDRRQFYDGQLAIVNAAANLWAHRPHAWVGWWVDGEYLYVDSSDLWATVEGAMKVARISKQLAIYDLATGGVLPVTKENQ